MGKSFPGRGRRPGLVVLLLCVLACCVPARGQGDAARTGPAVEAAGSGEGNDFVLKPSSEILRHRARPLYTRPAGLLLFLPGPLFLLAVLLLPASMRRKWPALLLVLLSALLSGAGGSGREANPGLREAEEAYARGEFEAAAALLESALEADFPDNPAILYNLALCRHLLGERGRAIHLLRKGLTLNSGDRMLRGSLLALEREYGLSGQLALPPPIGAGLSYALTVCFVNLAFAAGALFCRRRQVQILILLVLLTIVALVFLGFHLTLRGREQQRVGVVGTAAAELKMIPRTSARGRLRLVEGTSLSVLGEDGRFVLVETGFGFKGWVEKEALLID